MIRPISVNTYKSNYKQNVRPNFGAKLEDTEETVSDKERIGNSNAVSIMGIAAVVLGVAVWADFCNFRQSEANKEKSLNKFFELQNSPDVQKDTFSVKDVNDDKVPDIVLYKKDGSQVVYDVKNNEILEGHVVKKTEYSKIEE